MSSGRRRALVGVVTVALAGGSGGAFVAAASASGSHRAPMHTRGVQLAHCTVVHGRRGARAVVIGVASRGAHGALTRVRLAKTMRAVRPITLPGRLSRRARLVAVRIAHGRSIVLARTSKLVRRVVLVARRVGRGHLPVVIVTRRGRVIAGHVATVVVRCTPAGGARR